MAGLLIIAHTPYASALQECVRHIYGDYPVRMRALDVNPDDNMNRLLKIAWHNIYALARDNGVLVLTDLVGSTPANLAGCLLEDERVRVLSGVNLPMLVRAVSYRTTKLDTLVEKAQEGGKQGIVTLTAQTPCHHF